MPAGDGSGPMGAGPMTGRGAGYCGGAQTPDYMNLSLGRGFGMGRGRGQGRGRGWRYGWYPLGAPDAPRSYEQPRRYDASSGVQEAQALRVQAEHLAGSLDQIRKRIAELEAAQNDEE